GECERLVDRVRAACRRSPPRADSAVVVARSRVSRGIASSLRQQPAGVHLLLRMEEANKARLMYLSIREIASRVDAFNLGEIVAAIRAIACRARETQLSQGGARRIALVLRHVLLRPRLLHPQCYLQFL